MDLIYRRTDGLGNIESGYLSHFKADFDITTDLENESNDFEVTTILPEDRSDLLWIENEISCLVFVDGTEFGGEISGAVIDINENTITYTGRTWRGSLAQYIIEPPAGEDYRTVSGNVATIIRALPMNPDIEVAPTTYSSGTYKFNRYITTEDGIAGLLKNVNLNLRFTMSFDETTLKTTLNVEMARDLRDLIEVSQDYSNRIRLRITVNGNTPKHLICLGSGELHEREVIHLYANDDWVILQTPIAGAYPVATYDYSGSEQLLQDGIKHYTELIGNHRQIDVSIHDLDIKLSDIIGAKDYLTGEYVSAEITRIVWRAENFGTYQNEDFEYETKVRK